MLISGKRRFRDCSSALCTGQPMMMRVCRRGRRSANMLRCSSCMGCLSGQQAAGACGRDECYLQQVQG